MSFSIYFIDSLRIEDSILDFQIQDARSSVHVKSLSQIKHNPSLKTLIKLIRYLNSHFIFPRVRRWNIKLFSLRKKSKIRARKKTDGKKVLQTATYII